jgi:hypothetical protein
MRSILRVFHETMLHGVKMRVVHVGGEVLIVADRVLPYRRCQMPRSPRLLMTGDRGSPVGTDFENAVLIARQRPGKSASPSGKVHRQCIWSGRTTRASIWNGARRRACRTALRNASICVTDRSDRRSSKFTVKKNVPPGTRAAIVRHKRIMPNLEERRNALCFSALRLLGTQNSEE